MQPKGFADATSDTVAVYGSLGVTFSHHHANPAFLANAACGEHEKRMAVKTNGSVRENAVEVCLSWQPSLTCECVWTAAHALIKAVFQRPLEWRKR